MICGAGERFDCPCIMVENIIYAQKTDTDGEPISLPGWWYLWNRYYPYPVSEEHVFPIGGDYRPTWNDCVWKPTKEAVPSE